MSAPGKGHKGKPFLVEQQIKCLDMIPNSGIVLTTDLGKEFEYHYPQANIVGERFAILALSEAYQMKGFPAHGPLLEGVVIETDGPSSLIKIHLWDFVQQATTLQVSRWQEPIANSTLPKLGS